MTIIKRTVITYLCGVCGSEYNDADSVLECEQRPLEKQKFFEGDVVKIAGKRMCIHGPGEFRVKDAVIEEVSQPKRANEKYEREYLGGKKSRIGSHVRIYKVGYDCQICGRGKMEGFYAPELKLVSRKAKSRRK